MTSNNTDQIKIAVSYLRVSTARQMNAGSDVDAEGNSIATQRVANNAKAAKLGALVQEEFVEPGASAQSIDKRPVFKRLLAYLEEHPEVNVVIVYMRSRAFRNLGDAVVTKRRLEAMGVKLVSAKEDFGDGIMADAMEAVTDIINEVQVRMNGEDIKTKMRHKAQMGGTNGRARVGYLNVRIDHDGRQVNSIALDPERAPLVRQAFELYATDEYSLSSLHEVMDDLGLTTRPTRARTAQALSISQLHRMLRDSYYIGLVSYKDETFQGRHEPIIDATLFERVQAIFDQRSPRGQRDRVLYHYLKGLLYCARCDRAGRQSRLVYTEAKGRGGYYGYFLCMARQRGHCDLPHLPVASVEHDVADHYATLGLPSHFIAEIRAAISEAAEDIQRGVIEMHESYRKQLETLGKQEERLLDLAIEGDMPKDRIRARLRDIKIKRAKAKAGLQETGEQLARGASLLQRYLDLLQAPHEQYQWATDDLRRSLTEASFAKLFLDDDGVRGDEKVPVIQELIDAASAYDGVRCSGSDASVGHPGDRHEEATPEVGGRDSTSEFLLEHLFREGSSKRHVVPSVGFEPTLPGF